MNGTTARLLTPRGIGGIAVIELNGRAAESIMSGCFRPRSGTDVTLGAGRAYYGHVLSGNAIVDEVLIACTVGDDGGTVFEINCHGGIVVAQRVLELLWSRGAVSGDGGACVLGRGLGRIERDVFAQLMDARTTRAADVLLVQLAGRLRLELEAIVAGRDDAFERVERLCRTSGFGRRLVTPATVVITGAPNVGKSTLANALAGRERSIVHHLPGTTRDAVSAVASIDGLPVVLVDTAGLRETADEIERVGVEKALAAASACDVVIWVFDHSRDVTHEETRALDVLSDMPMIPLVNKIDLAGPVDVAEVGALVDADVQRVCALTGRGVDEVRRRVFTALVGAEAPAKDAAVVTTKRVRRALDHAVAKRDSEDGWTDAVARILDD